MKKILAILFAIICSVLTMKAQNPGPFGSNYSGAAGDYVYISIVKPIPSSSNYGIMEIRDKAAPYNIIVKDSSYSMNTPFGPKYRYMRPALPDTTSNGTVDFLYTTGYYIYNPNPTTYRLIDTMTVPSTRTVLRIQLHDSMNNHSYQVKSFHANGNIDYLDLNFKVYPKPNLNVTMSTGNMVCYNTPVKYKAVVTNINTNPVTVIWYKNGIVQRRVTYSNMTSVQDSITIIPAHNDTIYCKTFQDNIHYDGYNIQVLKRVTTNQTNKFVMSITNIDSKLFYVTLKDSCLSNAIYVPTMVVNNVAYVGPQINSSPYATSVKYKINNVDVSNKNNDPLAWVPFQVITAELTSNSCPVLNSNVSHVIPEYEKVTINASATVVNLNDNVTFKAEFRNGLVPGKYFWEKNGTSIGTNDSILILKAGVHFTTGDRITCKVQVGQCMINSSTIEMNIRGIVGLNEVSTKDFKVYPVPFNNTLNIETDVKFNIINIIDMFGKILVSTNDKKIDTSNLPSGMYILKFDNSYAMRVIKQ